MNDSPHARTRARKRRTRTIVGLCLAGGLLVVLLGARISEALTHNVAVNWRELIFNFALTVLAVIGVEILLEGFSLREEDFGQLEKDIQKILARVDAFDSDALVRDVVAFTTNKWEKGQPLIDAGTRFGLERVFSSRDELENEIFQHISNAEPKEKIWLLAVTFSSGVRLEDRLLGLLRSKLREGVEIKILAENAIRSIAVFRTFLETSSADVRKMVPDDEGYGHYFDHRFYLKFRDLLGKLDQYFRDHQEIVRFYPHSPSCWMVRIGNRYLYYQPYVLGRIAQEAVEDDDEESRTIGDLMPVFKFTDANKKPFRSLIDHFDKLWSTSDVDMFHMGARVANKDIRLKRIFKERGPWFQHVVEALRVREDERIREDRRAYPRKLYRIGPGYEDKDKDSKDWKYWTLNFSEGPLRSLCPITVIMEDVSYDGCALRIDAADNLRRLFLEYSEEARKIQENPQFSTNDIDIQSYKTEYIKNLQNGIARLVPPASEKTLKELHYLVSKMREQCNLEFKMQNWNWDNDDTKQDLLIGMQYRRPPRRVSNLPCVAREGT